jgi:hypothetical protein
MPYPQEIMSLDVLEAHETANGVAVTFVTDYGLEPLEGSCAEIARLAEVMQQVSAIAPLNESERVWLEDVVVGDATVRLGLEPGGGARVMILREQVASHKFTE